MNEDMIACFLCLAVLIAFIYYYAKALSMVKSGRLVVYSDWSLLIFAFVFRTFIRPMIGTDFHY